MLAASCDHTLKLEAAARAAREKAQSAPENPALTARAEHAEAVEVTLEQRTHARQAKGKSAGGLSISPVEPEAVVQPQKNHQTFAPSDQPSMLTNDVRIIVASNVDPSQEVSLVPDLLDQANDLGGSGSV